MTATATLRYATEACTRCNGQGAITMYSHVAGGACAKCNATGQQLSRAGRAAKRAHDALITDRLGITAGDLVVGDEINHDGTVYRVDQIERFDVTESPNKWVRDFQPYTAIRVYTQYRHGMGQTGYRSTTKVTRHDPVVAAEVATDIAARFAGAELI